MLGKIFFKYTFSKQIMPLIECFNGMFNKFVTQQVYIISII